MKTIKNLKDKLAELADKIQRNKAGVKWQFLRWKRWNRKALAARDKSEATFHMADNLRKEGHIEGADRKVRQAGRQLRRSKKFRELAQAKVGRIKTLKRHILKLDELAEKALAELEAENEKRKVTVHVLDNRVSGGTTKARFRTAALVSSRRAMNGKRSSFYNQGGTWTVDHCLTGEAYSMRSDCSQWGTSVCWTAGLPDPNGTDWTWGWTGTMEDQKNGWHFVSEAEMRKRGWGLVIYGPGDGHHVEAYVGNGGDLTIGHGSAPIDPGVIDLFGDGDYRCLVYK